METDTVEKFNLFQGGIVPKKRLGVSLWLLVPVYPSLGSSRIFERVILTWVQNCRLSIGFSPALSLKHETCSQTGSSRASKSTRFYTARADNMRRDRRAEESPASLCMSLRSSGFQRAKALQCRNPDESHDGYKWLFSSSEG